MCDARRAAGALLVLCLAAGGAAAQTIDTIVVERRDVFGANSGAPATLARLGDALHMMTRDHIIRRTLILDPGDPYDSARVAEAERDLRALGVFRNVQLDTLTIGAADSARLALRVRTADGWSTKPQFEFRSTAGDVTWQLGLVEENFAGTATVVAATYGQTPDRNFLTLDYANPKVIWRRARMDLAFARLTDGTTGGWRFGVPFFETASRHALLTYGNAADQRIIIYREGLIDTTYRRKAVVAGGYGGLATWASSTSYRRLWLRAAVRREDYGPDTAGVVLPRSVTGQLGVGFETGRERWVVRDHLDTYARREDVDLSPRIGVGVWALPAALGYEPGHAGVGLELGAHAGAAGRSTIAIIGVSTHGVVTGDGLDSARAAGLLALAAQSPRQSLIFHGEGAAARRIAPGGEYDLWLQRVGPRLFGAHALTGTRAWSATLEDRILVAGQVAGLVAVGLAPFVDAGGAWFDGDPARSGGNAGIAVRIGATRAVHGDVFEIATGYRWSSDGTVSGWAFSIGTAYQLISR
jgi:hypothetical protein